MDPRPAWLAPDGPADARPPHWAERKVAEAGLASPATKSLLAAGYRKLGDVAVALDNNTMPKLPHVGPGTLDKLRASIRAWRGDE